MPLCGDVATVAGSLLNSNHFLTYLSKKKSQIKAKQTRAGVISWVLLCRTQGHSLLVLLTALRMFSPFSPSGFRDLKCCQKAEHSWTSPWNLHICKKKRLYPLVTGHLK